MTDLRIATLVCVAFATASNVSAQTPAPPTIHHVTLRPDPGLLVISGTGLGTHLVVTVDGQVAPTMPGATDTQLEVLAPATVLTTAGTYRLTVVDPARQVGDGFVVANSFGAVVGSAPTPSEPLPTWLQVVGTGSTSRPDLLTTSTTRQPWGGPSSLLIEDPGIPYTTAVGFGALAANAGGDVNTAIGAFALHLNRFGGGNTASGYQALYANTSGNVNTATGVGALASNTTGGSNTASGRSALGFNTTGFFNTAVGAAAGYNATTGSYNLYFGAEVRGTATDANTMRLGLPYSGGVGQNRTFIAGIHGAQLTEPAVQVFVDANGQLGTLAPAIASGTGTTPIPLAVQQHIQHQQEKIAELQRQLHDAAARLARLESLVASPQGRK